MLLFKDCNISKNLPANTTNKRMNTRIQTIIFIVSFSLKQTHVCESEWSKLADEIGSDFERTFEEGQETSTLLPMVSPPEHIKRLIKKVFMELVLGSLQAAVWVKISPSRLVSYHPRWSAVVAASTVACSLLLVHM